MIILDFLDFAFDCFFSLFHVLDHRLNGLENLIDFLGIDAFWIGIDGEFFDFLLKVKDFTAKLILDLGQGGLFFFLRLELVHLGAVKLGKNFVDFFCVLFVHDDFLYFFGVKSIQIFRQAVLLDAIEKNEFFQVHHQLFKPGFD